MRGAALPGIIVAATVIVAIVMAMFGSFSLSSGIKIGIAVGLFFSLWGGFELMMLILMSSLNVKTKTALITGYFAVWSICIFIIFSPSGTF